MKFNHPFKPMLLTEKEEAFNDKNYLFELKFDGIRATIHIGPKKISIFNRNEKDITTLYPELKDIKKLVDHNMIFDGEIVLFIDGKPSFSKLQERSHLKDKKKIEYYSKNYPVCFIAFDCLYNYKSIINKPLLERKEVLNQIEDNNFFIKTKYILKNGKNIFKKIKKLELEGIVAKKINSTYEIDQRSNNWIKIKNLKEEIFCIGGFIDKEENAVVSLYLGEYINDKLYFVGKVTMGKKNNLYQKILKEKQSQKSPFIDFNENNVNYLIPKLICKISYLERTENNHLRQPVFKSEIKNK